MRQFVYISTASDLHKGDLAAILASAQRNNPATGITGFLLYNGRNFMQVIEGEEGPLIALMARLAKDSRHSGIVRLHDGEIVARDCPDWSMHHLRLSESIAARRASIEADLPATLNGAVRGLVANFAALN